MGSLQHPWVLVCLVTVALCVAWRPFVVAAPPTIDPCTLLTQAEIEHVIGPLQGKPQADTEGQAAWCNYAFANESREMLGAMPPQASPPPQGPCPDTSA